MKADRKACRACGKPTYSGVQLHPACKPSLLGGVWTRGVVQRWKTIDTSITAPPVGPDTHERLAALSKTEAEVLRLLAWGHPPEDIAAIRTTSIATVRQQVKRIRNKLGVVGGSNQLPVALAWRSGWITIEKRKDSAA